MSESVTTVAGSSASGFSPFWTLFRKELRTHFSAVLMLVGGGLILMMFSTWFSLDQSLGTPFRITVPLTLPLLVGLAVASTSFAVEKEEGTFQFLRTLPVRRYTLFWSKSLPPILFSLFSCVCVWPVGYWLLENDSTAQATFYSGWLSQLIALFLTLACSIRFSMSESRPMMALAKSAIMLGLITGLPRYLSMLNMSPKLDELMSWGEQQVQLWGILFFTVLIAFSIDRWSEGREVPSFRYLLSKWFGRREGRTLTRLKMASSGRTRGSAIYRIAWVQWKSQGWFFLTLISIWGLACWGELNTVGSHESAFQPLSFVNAISAISATIISSLAFHGVYRQRSFLVTNGFKPHQVWLGSLIIPAFLSVLIGGTITFAPPLFYTEGPLLLQWIMIGFAIGQLVSLMPMTLAVLLATSFVISLAVFGFHVFAYQYFSVPWPSWLGLIAVPLISSWMVIRSWLGTRMSYRSAVVIAGLILICLSIYPVLRVLNAPTVSRAAVVAKFPPRSDVDADQLQQVRQMVDKRAESSSPSPGLDFDRLFELDVSWRQLIFNDDFEPLDRSRTFLVQGEINGAIYAIQTQLLSGTSLSNQLHQKLGKLIEGSFKWGSRPMSTEAIFQWAVDRRTPIESVRKIFDRLGDENRFDDHAARIANEFLTHERMLDFSGSTEAFSWLPPWDRWFYRYVFWERIRQKKILREMANFTLQRNRELAKVWSPNCTFQSLEEKGFENFVNRYGIIDDESRVRYFMEESIFGRPYLPSNMQLQWLYGARPIRLGLALILFHREHPDTPLESLEPLIGEYYDHLPVDCRIGEPILFAPQGLDQKTIESNPILIRELQQLLSVPAVERRLSDEQMAEQFADRPFIWFNHPPRMNVKEMKRITRVEQFSEIRDEASITLFFLPVQLGQTDPAQ